MLTGDYTISAVKRFAQICSLFSVQDGELEVAEIARRTAIPRRTLPRILAMLVERNYLESKGQTAYGLGPAWLHLARLKRERLDLRGAALATMQRLRPSLNETYILGVRKEDKRVIIECMVSTQAVRRVSHVGFEASLHVGSAGRAILAGLPDDEIAAYLRRADLINEGFNTVTDPEKIWSDITFARREGFLTAAAEVTAESFSCSAPIRDFHGVTVASLTITLPLLRLTKELEDRAIATVRTGAKEIEFGLGYDANGI